MDRSDRACIARVVAHLSSHISRLFVVDLQSVDADRSREVVWRRTFETADGKDDAVVVLSGDERAATHGELGVQRLPSVVPLVVHKTVHNGQGTPTDLDDNLQRPS